MATLNPYDNTAAHNHLKSLMAQHKILEMFFNIDQYGFQVLRIKAQDITPFEYQISVSSFNWILNYLYTGKYNDNGVDTDNLCDAGGEDLDTMQKSTFKMLISENIGEVQQAGQLRDKSGRIKLYLNFNMGIIHFFMKPDEDIIAFMKEHDMRV